jgi:hypothetical protein
MTDQRPLFPYSEAIALKVAEIDSLHIGLEARVTTEHETPGLR